MRTILVPKHGDYNINAERTRAYDEGHTRCVLCGRAIKNKAAVNFLHDIGGGGGLYLHPDSEIMYRPDAGDMGFYPVGPNCLRQHPALREYVTKKGGQ